MANTETDFLERLRFDPQDHELLRIVDDVLHRGRYTGLKRLLAPYLHPHGIKEMAAPRGLRIAYAVAHLLGSLETGKAKDRLEALRSLRDEAILAAESPLRRNTARALLQIMKDLVRLECDDQERLKLARDFRVAVSGNPSFIREQLKKYHLLEMPEEWNQIAFDDHVHDANTKGRKSPTHLIMDAWIKGIRELTVVYYNYVRPDVAAELLEAAAIMEITVKVGVELCAVSGSRFVRFVWTPRGLDDPKDFLDFLRKPGVAEFMELGRQVSRYRRKYVMDVLRAYNEIHREAVGETFGVIPPEIGEDEFLAFVGAGQPSLLHMGRLIHNRIDPLLRGRLAALEPGGSEAEELAGTVRDLDAEYFIERYLAPEKNPHIHNPDLPRIDGFMPPLLSLSPKELTERISRLHFKNWITLNLEDVPVEEAICLLFACRGAITHLEVFNLKGFEQGRLVDLTEILDLRSALNSGNAVILKKFIRRILDRLREAEGRETDPAAIESGGFGSRACDLAAVLDEISIFQGFYKDRPLGARIGTDSTGGSRRRHGMGLVVDDSLPLRSRKRLRSALDPKNALPLRMQICPGAAYSPRENVSRPIAALHAALRNFRFFRHIGYDSAEFWVTRKVESAVRGKGNVHAMGGYKDKDDSAGERAAARASGGFSWRYMNSRLKNSLKILFGFIPAAVSFALTKDWWVLAWFGPVIWFGITGVRNVIQSVLGSGGLKRSPLLKWNDFVSWNRLCDSLFYTGFSVPLLDYFCKTLLLDQGFGVNTATSPITLYAVMALVNGLYISTHNALRGLPRKAIVGNFFRSILSIPLALVFNWAIGGLLGAYGVAGGVLAIDAVLQKWAAIISKFASDCVAGVIEGLADREKYVSLRRRDVTDKLAQLYNTYATLELLYPQDDVADLLATPKAFIETIAAEKMDLERIVIVNALDFLYFWMYQPRGRTVMERVMRSMSQDERRAFLLSQYVLQREKEISLLFIDGLVGRNFAPALAFYLDNAKNYLDEIQDYSSRIN